MIGRDLSAERVVFGEFDDVGGKAVLLLQQSRQRERPPDEASGGGRLSGGTPLFLGGAVVPKPLTIRPDLIGTAPPGFAETVGERFRHL